MNRSRRTVVRPTSSKNYLKPTAASIGKSRNALTDVTSQATNRKPGYTGGVGGASGFKTGESVRGRRSVRRLPLQNRSVNSKVEVPVSGKRPLVHIYNDENSPIVVDDESMEVEVNDGERMETEPVLSLMPHFSEKTQQILEEINEKFAFLETQNHDDDTYDPVMVADYSPDIFDYLRKLELKFSPNADYMRFQNNLNWTYRKELVDWLVKVHERFQLLPETLFLTINIMDRFLSKKQVTLNRFQLVGITALLIASKYEEINYPTLADICHILDNEYTKRDILQAEKFMIDTLEFEIGWPGPMSFLRKISRADFYHYEIRTFAKYFLESVLMEPQLVASPISWIAAGAYFLSKIILKDDIWSSKHVYYSGYTRDQLLPLVITLCEVCKKGRASKNAIWDKYSTGKFHHSSQLFDKWVDSMKS
ncbi:B-type cyclin CLB4 KNAG_0B02690 [Huiozyma naganishii CBS 8797]|uniref:Uncharacterized protein n=1 Tax=Huiozyma naganishii (strain ATCC MYA-139 / BCRC 22969 / CBS 8797 / KCTC 17520 / NBRC 10181 / NCYC 3082 / Yp74L-3) TaxID=1071383 RepID=J7RV00_HUIN7|nr:hypothetical protein KNAG_0B02690 [Kazachstania naganishii CBS 8797]CCK68712.1 hypothetical protein KNAG_0B02690 [Kazachstania naganishii CBS 8797]